jgi:hypothetical protein
MSKIDEFVNSLMYKVIMSGKQNGIVCNCETNPDESWVKWYDSQDETILAWCDVLNELESKGIYDISYPRMFYWNDGTPDPGDYVKVYNKEGEMVFYLHIICERYHKLFSLPTL